MASETSRKLLQQAGRLLARRAYARGELQARLVKTADEKTVEGVLNQLEQLHLLNDEEYAYNFAFCRMKQDAWGALRIRRALSLRHVAPELIETALSRVQAEIGEQKSLEEYLEHQKRDLPTDRKEIRRLVLHLQRRGFNHEIIYSALRRVIQPAAWQRFETGE